MCACFHFGATHFMKDSRRALRAVNDWCSDPCVDGGDPSPRDGGPHRGVAARVSEARCRLAAIHREGPRTRFAVCFSSSLVQMHWILGNFEKKLLPPLLVCVLVHSSRARITQELLQCSISQGLRTTWYLSSPLPPPLICLRFCLPMHAFVSCVCVCVCVCMCAR
jgi:hypothetical protein